MCYYFASLRLLMFDDKKYAKAVIWTFDDLNHPRQCIIAGTKMFNTNSA